MLQPTVAPVQTTYHAAHGRYFQALPWSPAPPADGDGVPPDLTLKPSYQAESLSDIFPPGTFAPTEPAQTFTHQYSGPLGDGYVTCSRVVTEGETWERCDNTGPETNRTTPWTKLEVMP